MYGIGAAVHIINILPFANFLLLPFAYKKGYRLFDFAGAGRWVHRRWWVRMFFGRYQYTLYSVAGLYFLASCVLGGRKEEFERAQFTTFYHDFENYEEEVGKSFRIALTNYVYVKRWNEDRDLVLEGRAQINHDNKIEAFKQYAIDNNL